MVDVSGAGDHVEKVENKIKTVKERYRTVYDRLPYSLPGSLVKELVFYCVKRMNSEATVNSKDNICARVRMTGKRIEYAKEYKLGFGDYAEARDPSAVSNSAEQQRTKAVIMLWPTGNIKGSWRAFSIATGKVVTQTQFVKLNTTDEVICSMNKWASKDKSPTLARLD